MARREEELNHLRARIDEELGLVQLEMADLSGPQPLPLKPIVSELPIVEALPEGMEQELQRMKAQIRRLGPINSEAQAEYEEARQRFEFLTQQSSDLEEAIEQLNQVIAGTRPVDGDVVPRDVPEDRRRVQGHVSEVVRGRISQAGADRSGEHRGDRRGESWRARPARSSKGWRCCRAANDR